MAVRAVAVARHSPLTPWTLFFPSSPPPLLPPRSGQRQTDSISKFLPTGCQTCLTSTLIQPFWTFSR